MNRQELEKIRKENWSKLDTQRKKITLYKPISEFKTKEEDKCIKCNSILLFIKIKKEAILFCPKCHMVYCEWYE